MRNAFWTILRVTIFVFFCNLSFLSYANSNADCTFNTDQTCTPSQLGVHNPQKAFGCKRAFLYQNQLYPLDSKHQNDAEKLRPIISSMPTAIEQLNSYQNNQLRVKNATYLGSIGIGLTLAGLLTQTILSNSTGDSIQKATLYGGLGLALGSTAYSIYIIKTNDSFLNRAVDNFNSNNQNNTIELRIKTEAWF